MKKKNSIDNNILISVYYYKMSDFTIEFVEICSKGNLSSLYNIIDQNITLDPNNEFVKAGLMFALIDGQLDLALQLLCLCPELSETADWNKILFLCHRWTTTKFVLIKVEKLDYVKSDHILSDEDMFYFENAMMRLHNVFKFLKHGIFKEQKNIDISMLNMIIDKIKPEFKDEYVGYIHPEMFIKKCEPRNIEYTGEFLFYYNLALNQIDEAVKIVKTGVFKNECNIHPKIVDRIIKYEPVCVELFKQSCLPFGYNSGKNTKKACQ